ncbi:MAG TPA: hypothetical protein VNO34_11225 [Actinomycetota bacterium]|nr:hypothetical protein [Actinomycetota bacterium]
MLGHAGGLGWDELALFGVIALVLGVVFLRGRRSGGEEEEAADQARAADPEGPGPRACPYCGSPVAERDRRCGACGFRLEGGGSGR